MTTWRDSFQNLDVAPWPGPRPIRHEDDERLLHGRRLDGERFLAAVIDHLLVVLTAESGVGKSSLLNGRLRPDLGTHGFSPVYISSWHFRPGEDPAQFIGRKVYEELGRPTGYADPASSRTSAAEFWQKLDDEAGDRLVVILDQFEELVRFQSGVFRNTRAWLGEMNKDSRIRFVISLRAEYHHHLRPLERMARPFTMTTQQLEPVSAEPDIRGLISTVKVGLEGAIDPKAAGAVHSLWVKAQADGDQPGLLHLQGLLYSLYHRARAGGAPAIRLRHVAAFQRAAEGASQRVFDFGLEEAVRTKLRHCREAAHAVGLDRVLVDGTDSLIMRIAPLLSSDGFKLVLNEWTVAQRSLESTIRLAMATKDDGDNLDPHELYDRVRGECVDDRNPLRHDPWPHQFLDGFDRWSFGPKSIEKRLVKDAGGIERERGPRDHLGKMWTHRYEAIGWAPWHHDPHDLSSGPMLGMPPEAVLYQELRRFCFAMIWLEEASLVRRSEPEAGRRMVSLVHDGFGTALERYASTTEETFAHAMARLTAARGHELHWSRSSCLEYFEASDSQAPHPLVNVRWRDCTVSKVDFVDTVFINGDFRGTRFEGCSFEGVSFVNCLLDNSVFNECAIVGGSPGADITALDARVIGARGDRATPDFVVEVGSPEVALLAAYRGSQAKGVTAVYSRTSGVAAHPKQPKCAPGLRFEPASGGIAVFGGRLNSLMFSACKFTRASRSRGEGTLTLRHIAGAALDLAEHEGGRIEIFDSTIRGLTITAAEALTGPPRPTELIVVTAVMANMWFDADVRGTGSFYDAIVTQLVNCSDGGFVVSIDSERDDNVPVGIIADRAGLVSLFAGALSEIEGAPVVPTPDASFARMDYRSRPAERELLGSAIRPDQRRQR